MGIFSHTSLGHLGVSENSVPHCTQWFCWSLSLWKMAISLGIYPTFSDKPILDSQTAQIQIASRCKACYWWAPVIFPGLLAGQPGTLRWCHLVSVKIGDFHRENHDLGISIGKIGDFHRKNMKIDDEIGRLRQFSSGKWWLAIGFRMI